MLLSVHLFIVYDKAGMSDLDWTQGFITNGQSVQWEHVKYSMYLIYGFRFYSVCFIVVYDLAVHSDFVLDTSDIASKNTYHTVRSIIDNVCVCVCVCVIVCVYK